MGNNQSNWKGALTPSMLAAAILGAIPAVQNVRETQVRQEGQIERLSKELEELKAQVKHQSDRQNQSFEELLRLLRDRKVVQRLASESSPVAGEQVIERAH